MNTRRYLSEKGPLLLAVNHPDSFLDAIILSTLFNEPVHSLARGDVFKNKKAAALLHSINMLPVYRLREGAENLQENYNTFAACREIFRKSGVVLIFSEGLCENEWHLRNLMKGTARLVVGAWEEGIPVRVLPIGLNYHSFRDFGKIVDINFGEIFNEKEIRQVEGFGEKINLFNQKLSSVLKPLVYEIDKEDNQKRAQVFPDNTSKTTKIMLALPAILGWLLHAPLYFPLQKFALKKCGKTGHFDSVLTGLLFFSYPLYLLLFALIIMLLASPVYSLWIFLMPLLAWSYVKFKTPDYCFDFKYYRQKKSHPTGMA
ncbi:MAG: 1-acyl-sn-glycerol-3-phosphate acyltransferase [Ferruginibacter sp.]